MKKLLLLLMILAVVPVFAQNGRLVISPMGPFENSITPSPTGSIGYFGNDGRIISSLWEKTCRQIKNNGGKYARLFTAKWQKKVLDNLWDVSQFNQAVFDDVKVMIAIAKKYSITCVITAFNNTAFHSGRIGPWTHNIQKKTFYKSIKYSLPLIRKMFAEFGYTFIIELCNEPQYNDLWRFSVNGKYCFVDKLKTHAGTRYADLVKLGISESFGNTYWLAMVWMEALKIGIKPENIIVGTRFDFDANGNVIPGQNMFGAAWEIVRWYGLKLEDINKGLQAVHSCGGAGRDNTAAALKQWMAISVRPDVFASSDKTFPGTVLDPTGKYKRFIRQTPAELYSMYKKIFLSMKSGKTSKNWFIENLTYIDLVNVQMAAVNKAHKEVFGRDLPGWGSCPEPAPPPKPPIFDPTEGEHEKAA